MEREVKCVFRPFFKKYNCIKAMGFELIKKIPQKNDIAIQRKIAS